MDFKRRNSKIPALLQRQILSSASLLKSKVLTLQAHAVYFVDELELTAVFDSPKGCRKIIFTFELLTNNL